MSLVDEFMAQDRPQTKFLGKYRATVLDNVDPLMIGRLLVMVPDESGLFPSTWAMPCVPIAGIATGFFAVPPIGSGVWVEFEQGDPDYPVWVGGYWGNAAEVPPMVKLAPPPIPAFVMSTTLQNTVMISDLPGPTGGIVLKSTSGATLIINELGIIIQNGQGASIVMTGPTVTINEGALVVT
jgi:uncharacterized protein involved in type VI secretion and phage assembly